MSKNGKKKMVVGWIEKDWVFEWTPEPNSDAGFLRMSDITRTRYVSSEKKVRITVEEICPKKR